MGTRFWIPGTVLLLASCATLAFSDEAARPMVFNFDADAAGATPKGFTADVGTWKVVADDMAPSKPNALAQLAENENKVFNVALAADTRFKDVDLSVRMKAVAGKLDQGGGPVWRAKDAKNYYVCRWNPLEDNFRFYTVVDGKRKQLADADLKAEAGWHTIRVVAKADAVECFFDGKRSSRRRTTRSRTPARSASGPRPTP